MYKNIKTYEQFVNEGVRDQMTGKSLEDIYKSLINLRVDKNNTEKLLQNGIKYNIEEVVKKVLDHIKGDYNEMTDPFYPRGSWHGDFEEFCEEYYNLNIYYPIAISIVANPKMISFLCKELNVDFNREDIQHSIKSVDSINNLYKRITEKNPTYTFEPPELTYEGDDFIEYNFSITTEPDYGYLVGLKCDMSGMNHVYYTYTIEPWGDDDAYCDYLDNYEQLEDKLKKAGFEL